MAGLGRPVIAMCMALASVTGGCGGSGDRSVAPASNVPISSSTSNACQPVAEATLAPLPNGSVIAVSQAAAEEIGAALFRACHLPSDTVSELVTSSESTTGTPRGPNAGQGVWLVEVDAQISEPSPGAAYASHFLIEVNQATGIPTIVGLG
jgi:hypothetical protein